MGDDDDETSIVRCGTSAGDIELELHRKWSPRGYDHAVDLFRKGFYDHSHFFRVVPGFLCQFGITYNPELKGVAHNPIPDDPQLDPPIEFKVGTISYAGSGPNSRTSHLFIALAASKSFGTQPWETPIGEVIKGIENVKNFYSYGDMPPWGKGPEQGKIYTGRNYIDQNFPHTDKFITCQVERKEDEEEAMSNRELLEEKDEWPVKAKVREEVKNVRAGIKATARQLLKKTPLANASIGGTDELGMLVVLFVIILAALLLAKLRTRQKGSKTS